jgi:hypothetical protein
MSRRQHASGPARPDRPPDHEAEAAAAVMAIAGLGHKLGTPGVLEHPAVRHELSKLEELITARIQAASTYTGCHRHRQPQPPRRHDGGQIIDAFGFDLRPDPLAATAPAQFIGALWQFKVWSGDPSWRKLAAHAGQRVVHSTMHAAMNGTTLPKLEVVKAIVIGCGGSDDDLRMFVTAWRRLESARLTGPTLGTGFLAAPVATLSLVPSG